MNKFSNLTNLVCLKQRLFVAGRAPLQLPSHAALSPTHRVSKIHEHEQSPGLQEEETKI